MWGGPNNFFSIHTEDQGGGVLRRHRRDNFAGLSIPCVLFWSLLLDLVLMCVWQTCVLDIYGNTEQIASRIGSIRDATFNCQIKDDSVFYGTGGNPRLRVRIDCNCPHSASLQPATILAGPASNALSQKVYMSHLRYLHRNNPGNQANSLIYNMSV